MQVALLKRLAATHNRNRAIDSIPRLGGRLAGALVDVLRGLLACVLNGRTVDGDPPHNRGNRFGFNVGRVIGRYLC